MGQSRLKKRKRLKDKTINMNEYLVFNDRVKKPYVKVVSIIFGLILIAFGFIASYPFGYVLGLLLIWASFFRKYTIVTEEAITINYDAKVFKYKELWKYSEITNIHKENVADLNYMILHFTKGAMSKRLVFKKEDALKIVETATRINPDIHVAVTK